MSLSKRVPFMIRDSIGDFVSSICAQVGLDFEREKATMVFAIHPGGPAILNQIRTKLGIEESQIALSRKVLYEHGNMASATAPHIWQLIVESPDDSRGIEGLEHGVRPRLDGHRRTLRESLALNAAMAGSETSTPQRFSVPGPSIGACAACMRRRRSSSA